MRHSTLGKYHYLLATAVILASLCFFVLRVHAQGWESFTNESTLEVLTGDQSAQEYWSTFWLVVIEGKVYLRLGSRGAARIEGNTKKPFVSIKIAGQRVDNVRVIPEPEMAEQVVIRWLPHPLTLRLERGT
jgi:hypothetical protein